MAGEDAEDKEKVEEKDKNFFQKVISYFRYDNSLDRLINISLLYNAYYGLIEIGMIGFYNTYISSIKLQTYVLVYILLNVYFFIVGFLPRISVQKILFFELVRVEN